MNTRTVRSSSQTRRPGRTRSRSALASTFSTASRDTAGLALGNETIAPFTTGVASGAGGGGGAAGSGSAAAGTTGAADRVGRTTPAVVARLTRGAGTLADSVFSTAPPVVAETLTPIAPTA